MSDVPDWVLIEAARRGGFADEAIGCLREMYELSDIFRLACDMIAKYEQPPVDPDVEAVKRIFAASTVMADIDAYFRLYPECLARAVAQYKKERAK